MAENSTGSPLRRCLGMRETVTITVGTVIGVGLFTVGANVTGLLGPAVIWASLAALAVSIYPALLYGEMGAMLPYAGGTYQYASIGLARPFGMLAGWNFIISMVSVTSGEALAFSFYLRTLLEALGISLPLSDTTVACAVVLLFLLLSIRGAGLTGRLQNGFLFFFWGVAAVWFLRMLPAMRPEHFADFSLPAQAGGPAGFLGAVAMVWWCFAGFETCCAMGEEIRYPQINLPRALFLAPFIVFAVNGLFQWVLLAVVPTGQLSALAEAAAPYAEGMKLAGVLGFPLILLAAGVAFGGDFSTLNASISVPPRYLFTMARDGVLPKCFARIHPQYQTPHVAILLLGLLVLLMISTGSIVYIASLSLFATLFYYIIGIVSACGLRLRFPKLLRPYRAPFLVIGAPVSILIYLLMMTQLDSGAVKTGILWSLLGLAVYFLCTRKNRLTAGSLRPNEEIIAMEAPDEKEHLKMDRDFHRWRNLTILAVLFVLALYAGSFCHHISLSYLQR